MSFGSFQKLRLSFIYGKVKEMNKNIILEMERKGENSPIYSLL